MQQTANKSPETSTDPRVAATPAGLERLTPQARQEASLALARWAIGILVAAKSPTKLERSDP